MLRTTQLATFLLLAALAAPAFATSTALKSAEAAKKFCTLAAATAPEGEDAEGYDAKRRAAAQRPLELTLTAKAAPIVRFDHVTSSLEAHIPRGVEFVPGFAITTSRSAALFELDEEEAHLLWARYDAGGASLRVTMLPAAWADYERPLCRTEGESTVLDGDLLTVQLVDEVGRPLATYQSPLGREVALMKQHRIRGYLSASTPVVSIVDLVQLSNVGPVQDHERLQSELRAALYGCYLRGLSVNARLQGALVLKLEKSQTTVLVDSLHSDVTRDCAMERVAKCWQEGGDESLKATVIFRLEDGAL